MVRRIGSLLVALQLTGGAALAAPPPPAPAKVEIRSVTHDAEGLLSAGRHLTVRLSGTSRGVARFHIAGVATGVGMRELRSQDGQTTTYVGTYVVRPGDAAAVAAVTASLRVGAQEIIKTSDRTVTVDARAPEITGRMPLPDATLENLRPNVLLRFHDGESSVDPAGVRLIIDGRDVTAQTVITDAFAAYTPAAPFRPGSVRIKAVVGDRAGNATTAEWRFTVARPGGAIRSVTVGPAAILKPGDSLTVVMIGAAGGKASFTTAGSSRSFPMRESPRDRGTYFGSYPIGFKDQGRMIRVSTQLRKGKRSDTARAAAAVPVVGRTPRPIVGASARRVLVNEQGIGHVTVQGSAGPAFRVVGLISARTVSPAGGASWTPVLAASTPVREAGRWRLSLGPFVSPPRAALFLTVLAVDPLNQRSPPLIVALGGPPAAAQETVAPNGGTETVLQEPPPSTPIAPALVAPTLVAPSSVAPRPVPRPAPSPKPASCASDRAETVAERCEETDAETERTVGDTATAAETPSADPPAPDPPAADPPPAERKPKDPKKGKP